MVGMIDKVKQSLRDVDNKRIERCLHISKEDTKVRCKLEYWFSTYGKQYGQLLMEIIDDIAIKTEKGNTEYWLCADTFDHFYRLFERKPFTNVNRKTDDVWETRHPGYAKYKFDKEAIEDFKNVFIALGYKIKKWPKHFWFYSDNIAILEI